MNILDGLLQGWIDGLLDYWIIGWLDGWMARELFD
jgi:hypothetical protein